MPSPTIADDYGLYWQIPSFVVDWTNHLILREVQGPDWSFSAILSSFDTLPGDLDDLLELYLKIENAGDSLEITIQGGRWEAEAETHPLGKAALYASVCKALIWLRPWRSLANGSMIRVFGLPSENEGPWLGNDWLIGDQPRVEIANCSKSVS